MVLLTFCREYTVPFLILETMDFKNRLGWFYTFDLELEANLILV